MFFEKNYENLRALHWSKMDPYFAFIRRSKAPYRANAMLSICKYIFYFWVCSLLASCASTRDLQLASIARIDRGKAAELRYERVVPNALELAGQPYIWDNKESKYVLNQNVLNLRRVAEEEEKRRTAAEQAEFRKKDKRVLNWSGCKRDTETDVYLCSKGHLPKKGCFDGSYDIDFDGETDIELECYPNGKKRKIERWGKAVSFPFSATYYINGAIKEYGGYFLGRESKDSYTSEKFLCFPQSNSEIKNIQSKIKRKEATLERLSKKKGGRIVARAMRITMEKFSLDREIGKLRKSLCKSKSVKGNGGERSYYRNGRVKYYDGSIKKSCYDKNGKQEYCSLKKHACSPKSYSCFDN